MHQGTYPFKRKRDNDHVSSTPLTGFQRFQQSLKKNKESKEANESIKVQAKKMEVHNMGKKLSDNGKKTDVTKQETLKHTEKYEDVKNSTRVVITATPKNPETPTTVVRIRRKNNQVVQWCDVYIGRAQNQGGWNLPQSKWHNPFYLNDNGSVASTLQKYERHIRSNPDLMRAIPELQGKVLGCWCKDKPTDPCHGDVLVKLVHEHESSLTKGTLTAKETSDSETSLTKNSSDESRYTKVSTLVQSVLQFPNMKLIHLILSFLIMYGGRIGIIVHVGLWAVPAFDSVESALRRIIQNGTEWYEKRLMDALEFNQSQSRYPTSGYQATLKYHSETYGVDFPYASFADQFTLKHFNVDDWMLSFKNAGASYAILTAKHHDGFCLWPTKTTKFSTRYAASGKYQHKDMVQEFKSGCEEWGLMFGVYYSLMEWKHSPPTLDYLNKIMIPQIEELIRYRPKIFWFDGDWPFKSVVARQAINNCLDRIRKMIPGVIINDRIGLDRSQKEDPTYLGRADYRVYADRTIPDVDPGVEWEHVNTIGLSWGYNRQQKPSDYKSGRALVELYEKVSSLNGRFLLNVGPDATGQICPLERDRLLEFGRLLP